MLVEQIQLENGCALGLRFQLQNSPLLVIRAEKGFLMCGFLDMKAAGALGAVAGKVKGVNSFEDVLEAEVVEVSPAAEALGVRPGMKGRAALEQMF